MVEGGPVRIEGSGSVGEDPLISREAVVVMIVFVDSTTVDFSKSQNGVVARVDGSLVLRESNERGVVASDASVDSVVVVDVEESLTS